MRSPLEHDPELIYGLGLITARWATLDYEFSNLIATFTKDHNVGSAIYYSAGNFQQRCNMVRRTIEVGFKIEKHREIALALLERVRGLWQKRNHMLHSRYVHRVTDDMGHTDLIVEGAKLRKNLAERRPPTLTIGVAPVSWRVTDLGERGVAVSFRS